ncbi:rhodanese-like domain-containing protein [Moraxella oblonga]|uniref:rhodanese-like domain-containing protein n=1 Tax=Moraxella oblonga TaxID=200413 RepID=UPI000831C53D|nr:rhodanese-like domain-containing protein [Moraxella oblonga]
MKHFALLAGVLLSLSACANSGEPTQNSQTTTQTQEVKAQEAPAQTAQTPEKAAGIWIDVRSPEEFAQGHLTDAVNIVHTDIASKIADVEPNKDAPINLYCKSGRRAEAALQELKKLGYTNVTNHGGYDDLVKQGLK